MKGKFITFEGTDGSGKTSVMNRVAEILALKGYHTVLTREPGGVKISEQIRAIIHDTANTEMDPLCEAFLYASSRRQHLVEKVIPELEAGHIILSDRYIDSSLAYQGYARGLGIDRVFDINKIAIDGVMPDLTLFLDVSLEVGLNRIFSNPNTHEQNRMDKESRDFHNKTHEGYLELLRRYPDRVKRVNGEASIEEVASECVDLILKVLE